MSSSLRALDNNVTIYTCHLTFHLHPSLFPYLSGTLCTYPNSHDQVALLVVVGVHVAMGNLVMMDVTLSVGALVTVGVTWCMGVCVRRLDIRVRVKVGCIIRELSPIDGNSRSCSGGNG